MAINRDAVLTALQNCYNFIVGNKGNTKPNACNSDGIPYYSYDEGYNGQIHESSTTSSCIALMCRAMLEAGYTDYAKQLADYIINSMTHNNVDTVNELVNLVDNGVEEETIVCGNFDSAVFTFTNGVATIPNGSPWYGENVIPVIDSKYKGVRGCWSEATVFPFRDYWIKPNSGGTEYTIDNYVTSVSGTAITLTNTGFSGDLQVYYAYRNGNKLSKDTLYKAYPFNNKCITTPITDYQLSSSVNGIQHTIASFQKLGTTTNDDTYTNYATDLLTQLVADSTIKDQDYYILDGSGRGLEWENLSTYGDAGRNELLSIADKQYMRFSWSADSNVTGFQIDETITWVSGNLEIGVRGDGSEIIRYIKVNDGTNDYTYAWYDGDTTLQELTVSKTDFVSPNNIQWSVSKLPSTVPTIEMISGSANITHTVGDFGLSYTDSNNLLHNVWDKFRILGVGGGDKMFISVAPPINTEIGDTIRFTLYTNSAISNLRLRIVDAIDQDYDYAIDTTLDDDYKEYTISLDTAFPLATHPYKKIGFTNFGVFTGSKEIYIANMTMGAISFFTGNTVQKIKLETTETTASYFDVKYVRRPDFNADAYAYGGVPMFSLDYSENGLMGWRSGSYPGHVNPYALTGNDNSCDEACKFLSDAQNNYRANHNYSGPFTPNYLRVLAENNIYGSQTTWTWNGFNENTNLGDLQYQTLANVADLYYFDNANITSTQTTYARRVLMRWMLFLNAWFRNNNNQVPSNFESNSSITNTYESPNFYSLVGRAMLLYYIIDKDLKAINIAEACLSKLYTLQQANGSFKGENQNTFLVDQANSILFLSELYEFYDQYKYVVGGNSLDIPYNPEHKIAIEFRTSIFEAYDGTEYRNSDTQYPIRQWELLVESNKDGFEEFVSVFDFVYGNKSEFNFVWDNTKGGNGNTYVARFLDMEQKVQGSYAQYRQYNTKIIAIDTNTYTVDATILDETTGIVILLDEDGDQLLDENSQVLLEDISKALLDEDGEELLHDAGIYDIHEVEHKFNIMFKNIEDRVYTSSYNVVNRNNKQFKEFELILRLNKEARQNFEAFFINQKGRLKAFSYHHRIDLGGDGKVYKVRFKEDKLEMDISYSGYATLSVALMEVL